MGDTVYGGDGRQVLDTELGLLRDHFVVLAALGAATFAPHTAVTSEALGRWIVNEARVHEPPEDVDAALEALQRLGLAVQTSSGLRNPGAIVWSVTPHGLFVLWRNGIVSP
jgi:hypothetical protein